MKLLSALLFTAAAVAHVASADKIKSKQARQLVQTPSIAAAVADDKIKQKVKSRELQTPVVMPVAPPSFVVPVTIGVPVVMPVGTPVGVPTSGIPGFGTPTTASSTKLAKKAYSSSYRGYRLYGSRRK